MFDETVDEMKTISLRNNTSFGLPLTTLIFNRGSKVLFLSLDGKP
jgi:hypothetical protein